MEVKDRPMSHRRMVPTELSSPLAGPETDVAVDLQPCIDRLSTRIPRVVASC
jgi:hypothetical protein